MTLTNLTKGCLAEIIGGCDVSQPVLQVLGIKCIPGLEGNDRYRLLVSDGKNLISYAMLATQLNSYATENLLKEYTIIRVEKYVVSVVSQEKKVVVILDLTILHSANEVRHKIGEPEHLGDTSSSKKQSSNVSTAASTSNASTVPNSTLGHSSNNGYHGNNHPKNDLPTAKTSNNHLTHPIASLSPYQNKWVIKARVTNKGPIRTWSNAKGEGKLFSMDLMDESGEIRATAFRDAVDKFYDYIQADKVYFISKCQLKPANKQFTSIKNDYEMTFTNDTVVEECTDAGESVPKVAFNLVPLSSIGQMEANAVVDIAGICRSVGDVFQFTARTTGKELKKRDITLVDSSLASVTLTLWNQDAENFDGVLQPVIFIKSARVNEFNGGKSVTLGSGSSLKINPDISEAHKLRGWYDNEGHNKDFSNVSLSSSGGASSFTTEWLNFYEAKEKNIGGSEKPDYFQCKAVVQFAKTNTCVYKSCPKPDCNKKVQDGDNGLYRCEKCNIENSDFKYRLLVNISIADWTTNRWTTVFSDMAEKMLECSSADVGDAFDNNKERLEEIFSRILFKPYIFKLRTKVENFGDVPRNKITAMNVSPINYKEYNSYLIKNIQKLTGIGRN